MNGTRRFRISPSGKEIAQRMRERIASGAWPANQRIPTKMELCRLFGTSNMTMQKALAALADEGFIRSRGRAGTFVTGRPPSSHRLALVVPAGQTRSLWYGSLIRALGLQDQQLASLVDMYQVTDAGSAPDDAALLDDCLAHRLAGALFAAPLPGLLRTIRERAPGFPTMHLTATPGADAGHGLASVSPAALVVGTLAGRGRQRLAVFGTFMQSTTLMREVAAQAQDAGLRCEPEWMHALDPRAPDVARGIARLMATLPAERRPDALFISDDHLATATTAGLHDAGMRTDGIDIICHANIPFPPPTCMPVTYVGYDVIALMRTGLDSLTRLIAGEAVPNMLPFHPIRCDAADMAQRQQAALQVETGLGGPLSSVTSV
jgi:DNA-binding LacI/PurR family transcriptional regulator